MPATITAKKMATQTAKTLRAHTPPGYVPIRPLPSLIHIILTPLRPSDVSTELPGSILSRASLLSQRLLREVHLAAAGSRAEDRAFTKLIMSCQIALRKALRGDHGWRTKAGRPAEMNARLVKAESGDFTGLREDMLKAHNERIALEAEVEDGRSAREAGSERGGRIMRAQRIVFKASYGKTSKALAQRTKLDSAYFTVQANLRALQSAPTAVWQPGTRHFRGGPAAETLIGPERVRVAIHEMDNESEEGPDSAGVRWMLIVASNEPRVKPDFSGQNSWAWSSRRSLPENCRPKSATS